MRPSTVCMLALGALMAGCEPDAVVLRSNPPTLPIEVIQRDLGKLLFFEKELSGPRDIACATCHVLFTQGAEPLALSLGTGARGISVDRVALSGQTIPRNTPDLFLRTAPSLTSLFWDGRVSGNPTDGFVAPVPIPPGLNHILEVQALLPLLERSEMRGPESALNELAAIPDDRPFEVWDAVMRRLLAIPGYAGLFAAAFPDTATGQHDIRHVARALVTFQLSIWSRFDSAFDRRGIEPLSVEAEFGRALFFGDAGCSRCHGGELLSDGAFYNLGIPQLGPGKDPTTNLDEGRMRVTGDPRDRFRFRTPPLRNVALTGPYMHNGAYDSLEDAVRHHFDPEASLRAYSDVSLPHTLAGTDALHDEPAVIAAVVATLDRGSAPLRPLTDAEVALLLAFLHSLSSEVELTVAPLDGTPASLPSGLTIDVPSPIHPSRLLELGF